MHMFNQIAGKYDFLNRFLSFGIDIFWRKHFVSKALKLFNFETQLPYNNKSYEGACVYICDLAAGTGDILIEIIKRLKKKKKRLNDKTAFICADFSLPMLKIAKTKITAQFPKISKHVNYVICDAENTCFKDSSLNAVFIAFGIRNFSNTKRFIEIELSRILKPSAAMIAILEFNNIFKIPLFKFFQKYYEVVVNMAGKFISGHIFAYRYLVDSIKNFTCDEEIIKILKSSNYKILQYNKILPYIVSQYIAILNK